MLVCAVCLLTLNACEKEKQASAEIGAKPKQIIDKVTNDINAATVLEAEKLQVIESDGASENVEK